MTGDLQAMLHASDKTGGEDDAMAPACARLLCRLGEAGGELSGPDGEVDRLFGPVAVRIAEQRGLVARSFGRNWGMGEQIRLTAKGRRAAGLPPLPLFARIAQALSRPPQP
jgi:hypothetical protein